MLDSSVSTLDSGIGRGLCVTSVLGQDTLLSQCLSKAKCILNGLQANEILGITHIGPEVE